jgi:hypothetical protein
MADQLETINLAARSSKPFHCLASMSVVPARGAHLPGLSAECAD